MVSAASNLAKIKVRRGPSWTVCGPTGCAQGRPKLSSQGTSPVVRKYSCPQIQLAARPALGPQDYS